MHIAWSLITTVLQCTVLIGFWGVIGESAWLNLAAVLVLLWCSASRVNHKAMISTLFLVNSFERL